MDINCCISMSKQFPYREYIESIPIDFNMLAIAKCPFLKLNRYFPICPE